MHLTLILLFLQLCGNVRVSLSQNAQQCPVIHVADNVQMIWDPEDAIHGNVVRFSCKSNTEVLNGTSEISCDENGEWSAQAPSCEAPKGCGRPPPLANGDTKNSAHSKYRHNDWVEYDCQHLYTMNGRPYKTCKNGEWTGQMKCLRPCTVTRETMNRYNIRFTHSNEEKLYAPHNDRITFSCTYGRRPVGSVGMHQVCNDGVIHLPSCQ
ncbi:complement factor H-related protein 2 [Labrus bergylta]|uniref:complement factor H-related protein 2 n=1 Tax=Labrus bergylta TaxID=56723 RepID=UPI003313DD6D